MSLTSRLLLGFAIISGIGFLMMMHNVLERVERQYLEAEEEPMVDMANIMAEMLAHDVKDGQIDPTRLRASFEAVKQRTLKAKITHRPRRAWTWKSTSRTLNSR
jgi:two-component system sensor histidine kinase CreC